MLESVLPRTEAASRVGGACAVDFCCESTSFHVVLVLAVFITKIALCLTKSSFSYLGARPLFLHPRYCLATCSETDGVRMEQPMCS